MTTIRFEREDAIGNIVLANPPFNRLDLRFAEALRDAVHQASESDIRVLVVRAEGPHFSFGGEVREWPGKDVNWFRTFVAEVNVSYRAIEMLKDSNGRCGARHCIRRRLRTGVGVRFSRRSRECHLPLRRSHDRDVADRRSSAADRRACRSCSGTATGHARRANLRTRSRSAGYSDACGARE